MANLGEKTAHGAVFSPKFGGGSGASGAGGGGRGSGQRQVHRCWGGTLARTASACMPQPDQVILPQVEHRAGRQVDVQLGLERPGHVDRREHAEALTRQRFTGGGDSLGERAVEDRRAAVGHQGLLGGVPAGHGQPAQWACECSAWSWSWPAWSWSASCSAICRRTSSMSSARTWPIRSSSAEPGRAPGWEKTRIPWRKIIRVGMDVMPAWDAITCSASVSTLPNTMSGLAVDAFSKTGANIRHGPHQAAQKSTNTMSLSAMVDSKVAWVRLTVDMLLLGGRGLSGHQYRIPLGVSTPDRARYSRPVGHAVVRPGPSGGSRGRRDACDGMGGWGVPQTSEAPTVTWSASLAVVGRRRGERGGRPPRG